MKRSRNWIRLGVFAILLTTLVLLPRIAAAEIGIEVGSVQSFPYGTFNGVAYVIHRSILGYDVRRTLSCAL
jgi:hypothetical protein